VYILVVRLFVSYDRNMTCGELYDWYADDFVEPSI
jgi:hypothetical protein